MKTNIAILTTLLSATSFAGTPEPLCFAFDGAAVMGAVAVGAGSVYSAETGFGWIAGSKTVFAVKVPEGRYDVDVLFASPEAAAAATVKAEARRLALAPLTKPGSAVRQFTVAVLTPQIPTGGSIGLKGGEADSETWNDRLTIEFLPDASKVAAIAIRPASDVLTVFIAGDSTVTDQGGEPWGGWGQMLPRFFGPGVAVANYAGSGRALFSFRGERRLKKILETMKPGDYLLIQFGHNDQKDKSEGAGPFTTYTTNLFEYVDAVRAKGGIPVILSPMERRRWKEGRPGETLTAYADAARQAAVAAKVPYIDLHGMSLALYGALGESGSARAFVHYPPNTFPGQERKLADNTHHNAFGAYELARCVVEGIRTGVPGLAGRLRDDCAPFDPTHPDDPEAFPIPPSAKPDLETPAGN